MFKCKKCGLTMESEREECKGLCPMCVKLRCSRCWKVLPTERVLDRKPSGMAYFCDACWPAKEEEMDQLATQILRDHDSERLQSFLKVGMNLAREEM